MPSGTLVIISSNISQMAYNENHTITTRLSYTETVVATCFYAFISLTAVFGNLLVMVAVKTTRNLQFTSNYLLANLALADFLQGALSLPLRLYELLKSGLNLRAFCPIAIPVSIVFGGTSNLNILFISVERLVAIRWPYLYYTHVTTRRVVALILTGWVSMVFVAILPAVGWGGIQPQTVHVKFCRFPTFLTEKYITLLYLFIHVVPITVVIFLYSFLLRISCSHVGRIHAQEVSIGKKHSSTSLESQSARRVDLKNSTNKQCLSQKIRKTARQVKAMKTVFVVVGFFIILVAPIVAIDVIEMLGGPKAPMSVIKVTVCMIYANQSVNVFIYAGFNSDYRKAFKRIISNVLTFVLNLITNK